MSEISVHKAVLLHEVVAAVIPAKAGIQDQSKDFGNALDSRLRGNDKAPWYLDGTLGGCGHALAIAEAFKGDINIIGLDQDPNAIERARESLKGKARQVILQNDNFRNLDAILDKHGIESIDMMLLDLGISSDELEASGKGFSFQKDEPLIMTFGDPAKHLFLATDIVNRWKEEDIANVIFGYSEDRYARRIAKRICEYRAKKKIETSSELAEIIKGAMPRAASPRMKGKWKIHPATKTFQALRITVNDELNALKEALAKGYSRLGKGGKMAVISFHSLEDKIVKDFYKNKERAEGAMISKKPIRATDEEIAENPRSRSAKMRIIQKI